MKKKLLALLLAFVMVAGMLPVGAFAAAAGSETTVGEVVVISQGGAKTVSGTTTTVLFGKGATIYYAGQGVEGTSTAGRGEGYHAGIKVNAPVGSTVDNNKVVANTDGSTTTYAKYRKTSSWWLDTDGTRNEWTEWADIELDGTNYMEVWGLVNPEYFGRYGNTTDGILYNHYQFDWNADNNADQDVFLNVTKEATLMKDDVQMWPVASADVTGTVTGGNVAGTVTEADAKKVITGAQIDDEAQNTATFTVKPSSTADEVKGGTLTIPTAAVETAKADETTSKSGVNITVDVENVASVTFTPAALAKVVPDGGAATSNVNINVANVSDSANESDLPENVKVDGVYEVKVTADSTPVEWGSDLPAGAITVTIPVEANTKIDKVYLDKELLTANDYTLGNTTLTVKVKHLSLISYSLALPEVTATGFIWDVDDAAAIKAATDAGVVDTSTWIDQTIWVAFDQALPNGTYYWFDVEINGSTYGIAAVGDGTHKAQAFSFLNLGQWENAPGEGVLSNGNLTAKITVYKTPTQLSGAPSEENKGTYEKINNTPVSVTIPAKPANANPNLKIESVTTDAPLYAKVKVSGMETNKVYAIRIAQTTGNESNMVILIVDSVTTYDLYCKAGQNVWVFEYGQKSDIVAGESNHTSEVSGTAQKIS